MECPEIPEMKYSDFSMWMHNKIISKRIPTTGSFEVTTACNLKCAHCYVVSPKKKELTTSEVKRIINEIVREGCLWLLITGGEPLTRPDFLEIYTYAKTKGLLLNLFTNGTLISSEIADHLQRWKSFSVEISLYGATKETYEQITGIPGSFKRCIQGIHLLVERKIPLRLKTMAMTLNKHELPTMKKMANDLGLQFRFDPVINPRLDGSKEPYRLRLSPDEAVALDLADEERLKHWKIFWKKFEKVTPTGELFICGAGQNSFHIDAFGRLSVCIMARTPEYDLRKGSFHEAWYEVIPAMRSRKRTIANKCFSCGLIAVCGQCPGWSKLEHGDEETLVDYLCEVTQLRAEAFGFGSSEDSEQSEVLQRVSGGSPRTKKSSRRLR